MPPGVPWLGLRGHVATRGRQPTCAVGRHAVPAVHSETTSSPRRSRRLTRPCIPILRAVDSASERCPSAASWSERAAPHVRTRARRAPDRVAWAFRLRTCVRRRRGRLRSRTGAPSRARVAPPPRPGQAPRRRTQSCGTPGGTTTTSPGPARIRSRRIRNCIRPRTTSKRSSCSGGCEGPPASVHPGKARGRSPGAGRRCPPRSFGSMRRR
jgi:hypothetical protein